MTYALQRIMKWFKKKPKPVCIHAFASMGKIPYPDNFAVNPATMNIIDLRTQEIVGDYFEAKKFVKFIDTIMLINNYRENKLQCMYCFEVIEKPTT